MAWALRSPDVTIRYAADFREYSVAISDGGTSGLVFKACPFCGQLLPPSKREDYFAELERRDLEVFEETLTDMQDDSWWAT